MASPSPERPILVVEDEFLIRLLAIDNLEELGFKVETASSAAEARSKLLAQIGGMQAAIVDLGLPDARGDELAAEMRLLYPEMPIVIASGQDQAVVQNQFKGQSIVGFLAKPYGLEQLRAALRALAILN